MNCDEVAIRPSMVATHGFWLFHIATQNLSIHIQVYGFLMHNNANSKCCSLDTFAF